MCEAFVFAALQAVRDFPLWKKYLFSLKKKGLAPPISFIFCGSVTEEECVDLVDECEHVTDCHNPTGPR